MHPGETGSKTKQAGRRDREADWRAYFASTASANGARETPPLGCVEPNTQGNRQCLTLRSRTVASNGAAGADARPNPVLAGPLPAEIWATPPSHLGPGATPVPPERRVGRASGAAPCRSRAARLPRAAPRRSRDARARAPLARALRRWREGGEPARDLSGWGGGRATGWRAVCDAEGEGLLSRRVARARRNGTTDVRGRPPHQMTAGLRRPRSARSVHVKDKQA